MTNEIDRSLKQQDGKDLKPYKKPTLAKGPVLSEVTALTTGSVVGDEIAPV